jgi:sugar lactone lactonase YvrE
MLYIANEESSSVTQWELVPYGTISVYAGIPGRYGSSAAELFYPGGITLDKYGNLYIADIDNQRIQMFCPNSVYGITIAGNGQLGNRSDEFYFPDDVALDADLNLYVSDSYNNRIQKFERIQ